MEELKCPSRNEQIKKIICNIYNGKLPSHKKNETMSFAATWIDLEIIILSETSQTERQILHEITYMWNLKYNTNELIYKIETNLQT